MHDQFAGGMVKPSECNALSVKVITSWAEWLSHFLLVCLTVFA